MPPRDESRLARCALFSGLSPGELAEVRAAGSERELARGETLFLEGEPAELFFVVVAGRLKLTQVGADGGEVIVRYVGPGEMCAAVALVDGGAYPATATAVRDSRIVAWHRDRIGELAARMPALALGALRVLSGRVRELQDRVRELSTERVAQRVARALVRLARQVGVRTDDGVLLDVPLSREDIAKMCGTTLFTVSRLLSAWESDGIVAGGRERVVIRRPHGLVAIAEDLPAEKRQDSPQQKRQ